MQTCREEYNINGNIVLREAPSLGWLKEEDSLFHLVRKSSNHQQSCLKHTVHSVLHVIPNFLLHVDCILPEIVLTCWIQGLKAIIAVLSFRLKCSEAAGTMLIQMHVH